MSLGEDYDERVLPSITNEVLKAIVVSYMYFVFIIIKMSLIKDALNSKPLVPLSFA